MVISWYFLLAIRSDWDSQYRPGDNLNTDCTLALDLDTGRIKWHFQHTPNDPLITTVCRRMCW